MVYYWCEIEFDEQGNIVARKALEICNGEKELINTFARLVKRRLKISRARTVPIQDI